MNEKSYKTVPKPIFVDDTTRRIRIAQATNLAVESMKNLSFEDMKSFLDGRVKFFNQKLQQYFADETM